MSTAIVHVNRIWRQEYIFVEWLDNNSINTTCIVIHMSLRDNPSKKISSREQAMQMVYGTCDTNQGSQLPGLTSEAVSAFERVSVKRAF